MPHRNPRLNSRSLPGHFATRRLLRELCVSAILLFAGAATADVPSPQEDCMQRNLAVCGYPSGVQSTQPGPCPAGTKTIKAQGHADCSAAMTTSATLAASPRPAVAQVRNSDLAWVGGVERWLMPALIYGVAGCALLWAVWRWRRRPSARASSTPVGSPAWLASGIIGALAGWKSAGMAFRHAFNSYGNHESAAPLLLSAPIWLGTFLLVGGGVFALLLLAWRRWMLRP